MAPKHASKQKDNPPSAEPVRHTRNTRSTPLHSADVVDKNSHEGQSATTTNDATLRTENSQRGRNTRSMTRYDSANQVETTTAVEMTSNDTTKVSPSKDVPLSRRESPQDLKLDSESACRKGGNVSGHPGNIFELKDVPLSKRGPPRGLKPDATPVHHKRVVMPRSGLVQFKGHFA